MGIPMIFVTMPAMVILLVPVIVIEGLLCRRWLRLTTWQAIKSNAVSNLASTIIGVPVAWAVMLGLELGTMGLDVIQEWHSPIAKIVIILLSAAWLGPPDRKDEVWVVAAATLVLLIPFFFASYWIEYLVVRNMIGVPDGETPNLTYPSVKIAVRNANLVTYGAMFLAPSIWLAISLHRS